MRPRAQAGGREGGFALLVVLWTFVLIAFLLAHLFASARSETRIAANVRAAAQLQEIADGAVQAAAFHLLDRSEARWDADGAAHVLDIGDARVVLRVTDEADKVNLNAAPPWLLRALFRAAGMTRDEAAALADAILVRRARGPLRSLDALTPLLGAIPRPPPGIASHLTIFSTYGPGRATRDGVVARALDDIRRRGLLAPDDQAPESGERVVAIAATASRADDARFERRAVLRLRPAAASGQMAMLGWEDGAGSAE